jgi:hypothetical protein
MDSVEEYFKRSGVNNWKTREASRMEWRDVVVAVKARTRLYHQYGDF